MSHQVTSKLQGSTAPVHLPENERQKWCAKLQKTIAAIGEALLQTNSISMLDIRVNPREASSLVDDGEVFGRILRCLNEASSCVHDLEKQQEIIKEILRKEVSTFPSITFGKADWEKYFGDIGIEPPLPQNIREILKRTCPYWPHKKVEDTHFLILIPKTVNGKPLTLNALQELIQNPKQGSKSAYRYYGNDVKKDLGKQEVVTSHWVLMTKDVIPESREKTFKKQKTFLKPPYAVPTVLVMAIGILTHYFKTGERLYPHEPSTWTRCKEEVRGETRRVVVGGFGSLGLGIYDEQYDGDDSRDDFRGLGALRFLGVEYQQETLV